VAKPRTASAFRRRTWRRPRRTSWIGQLFDSYPWQFGRRYAAPGLISVVVLYVVGLLPALVSGFAGAYIRSYEVAALALVSGWVLAWGAWSTRVFRRLPFQIAPAFRDPRSRRYREFARAWQQWVFNPYVPIAAGLGLTAIAMWRIWCRTHWLDYLPDGWCHSPQPHHPTHGMPHCAPDHLLGERLTMTFYFGLGGPLLGTMVWGFGCYVWFTAHALRRPLAVAPYLARTYLRPITSFGLRVGFGWSVAATLAAAFFARELSGLIAGVLAILFLMGLALIVYPQFAAHHALAVARDRLVTSTARKLTDQIGDKPRDRTTTPAWVASYVVDADETVLRLRTFLSELHATPVWIYSPAEGLTFVAEVLLPIATFAITRGHA
jgi:hypothetical protein